MGGPSRADQIRSARSHWCLKKIGGWRAELPSQFHLLFDIKQLSNTKPVGTPDAVIRIQLQAE
jgi:hypothetical protein